MVALLKKFPCVAVEDKVNRMLCESTESTIDANLSLDKAGIGRSEAEWQKYYKDEAAALQDYKDEDARVRNKIKPRIGMTKEYIYRHVMGSPDTINDTESASGLTSQWVYENSDGNYYLYFNNRGVLTTIQRNR